MTEKKVCKNYNNSYEANALLYSAVVKWYQTASCEVGIELIKSIKLLFVN